MKLNAKVDKLQDQITKCTDVYLGSLTIKSYLLVHGILFSLGGLRPVEGQFAERAAVQPPLWVPVSTAGGGLRPDPTGWTPVSTGPPGEARPLGKIGYFLSSNWFFREAPPTPAT
jgi:hypothetical protein